MKFQMIVQQTSVQIGDNVKFTFLLISTLLTSCSWLESDYDKLMNPIKDIKLAEKKAGKPNPTYDGVVEPDFPDEKLNNETLEGVDSNNDGVRDDVEIWINRVAEDEYVRITLKDYAEKSSKMYYVFKNPNTPEHIISELDFQNKKAMLCLGFSLYKYDKEYYSKGIHKSQYYFDTLFVITFNTIVRKKFVGIVNGHSFSNTKEILAGDYSFCSKKIPAVYFKKAIIEYQNNN